MPPSHAGRPGAGGGRSKRDRSGSGRYRSHRPGPSGGGLHLWLNRLARSLAIVLPPVLRVQGMMTTLVLSIPLT